MPVASRRCRVRRPPPTPRRWSVLVVALLAVWFVPGVGLTQTTPPTTWAVRMAPESRCTTDRSFLDTLAIQIPRSQRADAEHAELVAEIEISDGMAHIHVFDRVLQAEAGARELPLNSRFCSDIAESVALVLGVLVEAGRGALVTSPAAKPAPAPRPPPEPPLAKEREAMRAQPAEPVRVRPVWRGPPAGHELSIAAGVNVGLVPAPVLGFSAGWGIRPASTWPIWLSASGWTGAESEDRRGKFGSFYAGLLTCPASGKRGRFSLRACAGLHAGAVWASSQDLAQTSSKRRPVALVGVELAANVRIVGPLELTLIGRADALLMRSRFYYATREGSEAKLYDPSVIIGGLFGGLALRFR